MARALDLVVNTEDVSLIINARQSKVSTTDLITYLSNYEQLLKSINYVLNAKYCIGYDMVQVEPHDPTRTDNLGKAQGFAEYARKVQDLGRIQLIRKMKDSAGQERFKRLDMSLVEVQEKVLAANSTDDIDAIFRDFGFFD